jgi:hypothetical protein
MLSAAVIQEVRRLLDEEELSQRAIAARLNVSRGTVWAVVHRQRGLHVCDMSTHARKQHASQRLPERCSTCGGFVFMPCRLCSTRAFTQRRHFLATFDDAPQTPPSPRRAA